jgi:hypothetical protein
MGTTWDIAHHATEGPVLRRVAPLRPGDSGPDDYDRLDLPRHGGLHLGAHVVAHWPDDEIHILLAYPGAVPGPVTGHYAWLRGGRDTPAAGHGTADCLVLAAHGTAAAAPLAPVVQPGDTPLSVCRFDGLDTITLSTFAADPFAHVWQQGAGQGRATTLVGQAARDELWRAYAMDDGETLTLLAHGDGGAAARASVRIAADGTTASASGAGNCEIHE